MVYATIEDDKVHFKCYIGDVYERIMSNEETLGLIELAKTSEYIIYKTDITCCPSEHLVIVGNNEKKSLSLIAQSQLDSDFDGSIVEFD